MLTTLAHRFPANDFVMVNHAALQLVAGVMTLGFSYMTIASLKTRTQSSAASFHVRSKIRCFIFCWDCNTLSRESRKVSIVSASSSWSCGEKCSIDCPRGENCSTSEGIRDDAIGHCQCNASIRGNEPCSYKEGTTVPTAR